MGWGSGDLRNPMFSGLPMAVNIDDHPRAITLYGGATKSEKKWGGYTEVKRRIYGLVGLTWLTSKCLGNSLTHETRGGDTPWEISNKTSWRDTVAQAVFFFPHWKLIWTLPNNHDNHIYIYIIYIVYIYISGLQTMVTKVLICARPKLEHPPTSRREPPSLVPRPRWCSFHHHLDGVQTQWQSPKKNLATQQRKMLAIQKSPSMGWRTPWETCVRQCFLHMFQTHRHQKWSWKSVFISSTSSPSSRSSAALLASAMVSVLFPGLSSLTVWKINPSSSTLEKISTWRSG